MHQSFTEIMVRSQVAKHPPTTVEIEIRGPFPGNSLRIQDRGGLENPDSDFPTLHGAFLLGDAVDIRAYRPTVSRQVFRRVLPEFLDGHLVRMQPSGIVLIVVFHVDWVKTREQLRGDAIVEWLNDGSGSERMQFRIPCWMVLCHSHGEIPESGRCH